MVSLPSSEQATRLRELFHAADYRQQRLAEGGWRAESVVLRLASGIPVSIGIDENIRDVLARFDGTRSVEEVINEFASRLNVPPSVVQHDLLRVVRLLIEHVCLLP